MQLTLSQWHHLRQHIPTTVKNVFRTDTVEEGFWIELLAFDPVDTFILDDVSKLNECMEFLEQNQENLCAGVLSYDLGLALKEVKSRHPSKVPLMVMHAYNSWVENTRGSIQIRGKSSNFRKQVETIISQDAGEPMLEPRLNFETSVQKYQYRKSIQKIHDYIRAGDFYQINYTQELKASTEIAGRSLYPSLIERHPAAYGAYFESDAFMLHSLSPELFLHYSKGVLTTEPIKGTRPRGINAEDDLRQKQALLESEKEQAELYMITDLLRNDLGEVCEIGSISLDAVKGVQRLPKVWHTFSRIKGKLDLKRKPIEALLAMFPGGSITGCPKKRSLEVIDELEKSSRGIYTGSIGYFHPDGDFCFNIAIRTLIQRNTDLSLGSGGGITIDSEWEAEWNELLVKASTFE